MFLIDKYAYQNRWKDYSVHYKFMFYLFLLAVSFSGIAVLQGSLILTVMLLTCYVAKIPLKRYLTWYAHVSIFVAISLLTFILTYSGTKGDLLLALPFLKGYIGVSPSSLAQAGTILLRIYSSLVSTYFFALVTPFAQLIVLFKAWHLPVILLELIILMYRFIFLVLHEFLTIRDTLDLKFSFYHYKTVYRAWGMLANTLFLKLLDDNQRLNDVLSLKFDHTHQEERE